MRVLAALSAPRKLPAPVSVLEVTRGRAVAAAARMHSMALPAQGHSKSVPWAPMWGVRVQAPLGMVELPSWLASLLWGRGSLCPHCTGSCPLAPWHHLPCSPAPPSLPPDVLEPALPGQPPPGLRADGSSSGLGLCPLWGLQAEPEPVPSM